MARPAPRETRGRRGKDSTEERAISFDSPFESRLSFVRTTPSDLGRCSASCSCRDYTSNSFRFSDEDRMKRIGWFPVAFVLLMAHVSAGAPTVRVVGRAPRVVFDSFPAKY